MTSRHNLIDYMNVVHRNNTQLGLRNTIFEEKYVHVRFNKPCKDFQGHIMSVTHNYSHPNLILHRKDIKDL